MHIVKEAIANSTTETCKKKRQAPNPTHSAALPLGELTAWCLSSGSLIALTAAQRCVCLWCCFPLSSHRPIERSCVQPRIVPALESDPRSPPVRSLSGIRCGKWGCLHPAGCEGSGSSPMRSTEPHVQHIKS